MELDLFTLKTVQDDPSMAWVVLVGLGIGLVLAFLFHLAEHD